MVSRLEAYAWPGNVRELKNVIERAVITAQDGKLNLDRALPAASAGDSRPPARDASGRTHELMTADDLERLERSNIRRALEQSGWQVAGDSGAARLLGMAPSTLSSRIKALGVRRDE
jgi:transcriptional regulator with GAF, ATPase, and Fis domain